MRSPSAYQQTTTALGRQLCEAIVDHSAFEIPLKRCELQRCRATCCHDGAVLSGEEKSLIEILCERHRDAFPESARAEPFLRGANTWKTATLPADGTQLGEDFANHFPRTRCAFLDARHKCALQSLSISLRLHPWHYKPISCWMHPIRLCPPEERNGRHVLTILAPENDHERFASATPCGRSQSAGHPAREVLAEELRALSEIAGRDFLAELNAPPGALRA